MGLGNGNPKEGDKGSNFFWELRVLQGLEAIAVAIEAGGGGGGGGGITALTGDVTAGPGSGSVIATIGALKVTTTKIANNAVTLGKVQLINNYTFLGNGTGPGAGTGAVAELSLLNVPYFSGGIGGSATTASFLRGDGSWQNIGSAEGLSTNATTGNIELGKTALAGTADITVARFINSGTSQLIISGNSSKPGITSTDVADSAILRVINTSTTSSTAAIYASIATTANNPTNTTIGAAVYAISTGVTDDAVAIWSINTSNNANSVSLKAEATAGGIAGRFISTTQRALIANNTSMSGTGGAAPIESQKSTTASANIISSGFLNNRNPNSLVVPSGGGTSYDFSLNGQGVLGIANPTTARMSSYAIDMGVTTPGTYSSGFKISVQHNSATPTDRIDLYGSNIIKFTQNLPGPYADDTAASGAGVPQYALYRDASSTVKICQI